MYSSILHLQDGADPDHSNAQSVLMVFVNAALLCPAWNGRLATCAAL